MRWMLQATVAVAVFAIVGALSRVPYAPERTEHATLRLSWRVRGQPVQKCRNRTPEELEKLPIHMRTPQVCTGRVSSYRLELEVDDEDFPEMELRAAGAHADRPIYVFKEIPITAGEHEIEVEFYSTHDSRAHVEFEQKVTARAGEILLLTYDQERDALYLRRSNE